MGAWRMRFYDFVAVCVGVSAIIGAGFALTKLARAANHAIRRAMYLVDDLAGEPARPGFPARPGVLVRLATIEAQTADVAEIRATVADIVARVTAVEQQLQPNGGSSLRDAVDRTETATRARFTGEAA